MPPRQKKQAEPVNEPAAKADENGIYLDPDLIPIRDEEAKRNDVELATSYPEPEIDPELLKVRDAEIKRGDKKLV